MLVAFGRKAVNVNSFASSIPGPRNHLVCKTCDSPASDEGCRMYDARSMLPYGTEPLVGGLRGVIDQVLRDVPRLNRTPACDVENGKEDGEA